MKMEIFPLTPPDPRKKITINVEDIEIGVPKQEPVNPEDLIRTGVVTFFNDTKGYGFIKDLETQGVFLFILILSQKLSRNRIRLLTKLKWVPKVQMQ